MVVRCLSEKIWNIQLYQRLFDISVCGKFVVNDNYLTSSDTLSKKSSFVVIGTKFRAVYWLFERRKVEYRNFRLNILSLKIN